jgi:hypothetical protein
MRVFQLHEHCINSVVFLIPILRTRGNKNELKLAESGPIRIHFRTARCAKA